MEITIWVFNFLSKSNIYKSPDPDNIHLYFLKEAAYEIAPMLTLFQQSLDSRVVPNDWEKAYIIPSYKKGGRANPTNYQPILLNTVVSRRMEYILISHIMEHIVIYLKLNLALDPSTPVSYNYFSLLLTLLEQSTKDYKLM